MTVGLYTHLGPEKLIISTIDQFIAPAMFANLPFPWGPLVPCAFIRTAPAPVKETDDLRLTLVKQRFQQTIG